MRVAFIAAIVAGVFIAAQSAIIGAFADRVHPFVVATWVHVGGLAFGIAGVLLARLGFHVDVVRRAPWVLLAGVAGMVLVTGIAVAVGGLGLATTLATVTGAQLIVGFVIETVQLGDRVLALDPVRIAGAALIVVGVYLVASRGPAVT